MVTCNKHENQPKEKLWCGRGTGNNGGEAVEAWEKWEWATMGLDKCCEVRKVRKVKGRGMMKGWLNEMAQDDKMREICIQQGC